MNLTTPSDRTTISNLPFDASGQLIAACVLPRGAGFGVASGYQAARLVQFQAQFIF